MKALIIGVTGQDGSLLADHLLRLGIEVHGTFRRGSSDKFWRLIEMETYEKIKLHSYNIGSEIGLGEILTQLKPDLIFSVAGESFTQLSFEEPKHYLEINAGGTVEQLEAIRNFTPEAKVFFACSSEIFGSINAKSISSLTESSDTIPENPYGISKLTQRHVVRLYREKYGLRTYTGILFPHESPFRSREFVTRKITRGLVQTKFAGANPMTLGGTSMSRDWGSAFDYVSWMLKLLESDKPGDYIFSTGQNTSVEDFLLMCLNEIHVEIIKTTEPHSGIVSYIDKKDNQILIKSDSSRVMSNNSTYPPGSAMKLFGVIGAQKITTLPEIASQMIKKDMDWL